MDMLDWPNWGWGLSLIAVTVAIHAIVLVIMAFVAMKIRLRQESRSLSSWNLMLILVSVIGAIGLGLAVLHGLECAIWAAAYLWLGALDSSLDALLFSVDSMTTRGASGLTLQPHWQMMGSPGGSRRHVVVWGKHGLHFCGDARILGNALQTP